MNRVDPFAVIADPTRRRILDTLREGAADVGTLVERLGISQPLASKHLGVLRKVGVVAVHKAGQRRLYSLNPQELRPVHDWVQHFERFWTDQLSSIKQVAEHAQQSLDKTAARDRAASTQEPVSKEQRHGR